MKKYIIDGNNLIGKIKFLSNLQSKNKQAVREKTAHLIDRYFSDKKVGVILNFDGFANQEIVVSKIKIIYSEQNSADEKIKKQIEENNKRNIVVISSDNNLKEFAKVCGCEIILSETFGKEITRTKVEDDEELRIKKIDDVSTFKKMFNV